MTRKEKGPQLVSQSPALEGRVVAMPEYYLPKGTQGGMSQKTLLIIIVSVLVLLIIGVFSYIFLRSQPSQQITQQEVQPQTTTNQQPSSTTPEPEPEEEVEPEPEPPTNSSLQLPPIQLPNVQTAADTDQDGLTDPEELLFSTSASVPDTDQDSFLDGSEVVNLYDPATPGALLEVSPQIKIVTNTARGYQLLIPATWTASNAVPGGEEYLVRPPDGTEQFIITMFENPDRMTPVQWYQQQLPGADLSNFNNFQNEAGWSGIQSRDGRVIIATFGTTGPGAKAFIFLMQYDPGNAGIMRFPTVWKMMTASLAVVASPEEAAVQSAQQQNQQPSAPVVVPSQTDTLQNQANQQQQIPAGSTAQQQQAQTPSQQAPPGGSNQTP